MEPSKKCFTGAATDVTPPVAGAPATTMIVDVPTTSTTNGWLLGTSLVVTSVLAGGAPTAVGVTGVYVRVALSVAGVLVSLALVSVGVVPSVAVAVVDEEAIAKKSRTLVDRRWCRRLVASSDIHHRSLASVAVRIEVPTSIGFVFEKLGTGDTVHSLCWRITGTALMKAATSPHSTSCSRMMKSAERGPMNHSLNWS